MKALVVYESMFGNTQRVATAVAEGLVSAGARVTLRPVDEVDPATVRDYDVVVAGAPTHAWSLPRPTTREEAVRQGGAQHGDSGLREWLDRLDPAEDSRPPRFALFDTRIGTGAARHMTGSAARRAARGLHRAHRSLADGPASFYVEGSSGPLLPGETARARAWGNTLAHSVPVA